MTSPQTKVIETLKDTSLTEDEKLSAITKIVDDAVSSAKSEAGNGSITSMFSQASPAAQDPLLTLRDVFADSKDYTTEELQTLIHLATSRFTNRRRMAYISLTALVAFAVFLGAGFTSDVASYQTVQEACVTEMKSLADLIKGGADTDKQTLLEMIDQHCFTDELPFSKIIADNWKVITWLGTFFTSIIGIYFGAASFRPSS